MFSSVARYVFLLSLLSFPCLGLRAVWMCLEPLLSFFRLSLSLSNHTRFFWVQQRSAGLHIGGRLAEGSESKEVGGGSGGLPVATVRAPLVGHPPLPGKGKKRISEIRYPTGLEYLRAAMRCSDAAGPSRVEPSYAKIFSTRYRPLTGIHVWRPNFLTSYVLHVPKMVCFFKAAFENALRFPLHSFIKCVLQHFNVCPTQQSRQALAQF